MSKKRNLLLWTPRVLSLLFILFLSLFSLDVFEGNYGFWGTALALFMHNIPSLVLLGVLLIAWKYKLVGMVAFALAGLAYLIMITSSNLASGRFEFYMLSYSFIISGPAIIIAILFFVSWRNELKVKG
ncbi:MAG: hypothetical protein PHC70_00860 [Patescibacteria group bacterium]|nr:hypothetical protein [Patescibacteria group bacterium]